MYYPEETVEDVLHANNIVDVVGSYVHLQKRGSNHFGLCPFHNEKTPSFSVSEPKQIFYCFGCGVGGNAVTFLMKYENYSFAEALQTLADRAGIKLPEVNYSEEAAKREEKRKRLLEINRETAVYYYRLLRSAAGRKGALYFKGRGLTAETLRNFGLGFADGASSDLIKHLKSKGYPDDLILEAGVAVFDERRGMHDKFWNRVIFPIFDMRSRVIGFGGRVMGEGKPKYLNSPETEIFNKRRNMYGLHLAKRAKSPYFILCEGYMDVIAMHQAGFSQAVASLGTSFTREQASLIKRYVNRVLLAYDSDGAGVRAAMRAIGILKEAGIASSVINMSPQKDPDEFIKENGRDAFQDRIDHAENSFFYELRILERDYRMDDPAQRTQFHHVIVSKLREIGDEIERENYLEEAAARYYIKPDLLRRMAGSYEGIVIERDPISSGEGDPRGRDIEFPDRRDRMEGAQSAIQGSAPAGPGRRRKLLPEERASHYERLMLTWLADEPAIFPQIAPFLRPEHFMEGVGRQAAERYYRLLESGRSAAPASVIAMFETEEEQEEAASMFNTRLAGLQNTGDREKALRDILIAIRKDAAERERAQVLSGSGSSDAGAMQRVLQTKKDLQDLRKIRLHLPQ